MFYVLSLLDAFVSRLSVKYKTSNLNHKIYKNVKRPKD